MKSLIILAGFASLLAVSAIPLTAPTLADAPHNCYADIVRRSNNRLRRRNAGFGYEGDQGPLFWADLDPNNKLCRTGQFQSPINLVGDAFKVQGTPFTLEWADRIDKAEFLNEGVTAKMELRDPKKSTLVFENTPFTLEQFHFHTPSEHHVNDRALDAEIHFVHLSSSGKILVIGVMVEVDERAQPSSFFDEINRNLPVGPVDTKKEVENFDLTPIKDFIGRSSWNSYEGSLTTPPCSEGVRFIVSVETLKIPLSQLNELKKVVPFNARLTQASNGRGGIGLAPQAKQRCKPKA